MAEAAPVVEPLQVLVRTLVCVAVRLFRHANSLGYSDKSHTPLSLSLSHT